MLNNTQLALLGNHMRGSANDREGITADSIPTVPVRESWEFVKDNAGEGSADFFSIEVPSNLPEFPPHAFVLAYYSSTTESAESIASGIALYMASNPAAADSIEDDAVAADRHIRQHEN